MKYQENRKIAEDFLGAYGAHDYESISSLLYSDVEWSLPGQGSISGIARGPEAVIQRVQAIVGSGIKTELHYILTGQFGATLSLHNRASKPNGQILDEELATVLTIDSGRIKKIDTYLSDVPMMEAFFQ